MRKRGAKESVRERERARESESARRFKVMIKIGKNISKSS